MRGRWFRRVGSALLISAAAFGAGVGLCMAQEVVTITTYFPSPNGTFRFMRILPGGAPSQCHAGNEGTVYFDSAQNRLFVCEHQSGIWPGGTWGWGGLFWTQSSARPQDAVFTGFRSLTIGGLPQSGPSPTNGLIAGNLWVNDVWLRAPSKWASQLTFPPGAHCGASISGDLANIVVPCLTSPDPRTSCPAGFTQAGGDFDNGATRRYYVCVKNNP